MTIVTIAMTAIMMNEWSPERWKTMTAVMTMVTYEDGRPPLSLVPPSPVGHSPLQAGRNHTFTLSIKLSH